MSQTAKKMPHGQRGREAGSAVFSCLAELLACHGRMASGRKAILGPACPALTYGGLWTHANDTVRALRSVGVGRADRVAVVLPNGPQAAAAMVAVAAGAVCVPLNPDFTADEWRRYFADLRVSALLTRPDLETASRSVAQALGMPVIDLPGNGGSAFSLVGSPTRRAVDGDLAAGADDAFILLTSGSTSRPKMVPLTHAAVCQSAYNVGATLALGPRDRLLGVLPLFHVHGLVSGLVAALAAGSSIVCTTRFDAVAFFDWLEEFRPTWYTAVPAIHRAVLSAADAVKRGPRRSLRIVRSASSTLPPDLTVGLEGLFGVPVIDTFGMTEAASQIAANPVSRRKPGSVGQSAGAEIAIIDRAGRRLPAGKRGELVLRGPTITRGYDNDAAATAAAFRDGWFRTGDLGYLDRDGYLFIVGRIKDIINRGGQKVAPAEVEQALLSHPAVAEAAAFSVRHDRLGEDVAAAVVLRRDAQVSAQDLRDFARERLAPFKVPGLIRLVPEIPKGPAGKIKRGDLVTALSIVPPKEQEKRDDMSAAPRSDLERQLANIWTELLGLDRIGVDDDAFALGADSITMTQMRSRLKEHIGVDLSFRDLFALPTVAALAARIASSEKEPAAQTDIVPLQGHGPREVSIVQEHVLRIERELPGLPQFNRLLAYRLQGPLNVSALERSLAEVVRRHEALRTRFAWRGDRPVAIVAPVVDVDSFLVVEDLARAANENARARTLLLKKAELEVEQEALTAFDVGRAPLLRLRLLRLAADDHVLLLIVHDLIADGWSMGIFVDELSRLYAAFAAGRPARLPAPALQFSDFARWQRRWSAGAAATRQLASWKRRLRDVSPVFPATDAVAAEQPFEPFTHEPAQLSNDLVTRLGAVGHSRGATLFMTLLAAFKTLLMARSGRNDICIATAMANRSQLRMERVIGPVGNTTLIRTRLDPDLSFEDALGRVRESVLEAHAGQELPFDVLAARLAEEDGLDPGSLIQVFFLLQNAFDGSLALPGVAVEPFASRHTQPPPISIDRYWLAVRLNETPSGITGACRYKDALFEPGTRRHWMADYQAILAKAAASPQTSLSRLGERSGRSLIAC